LSGGGRPPFASQYQHPNGYQSPVPIYAPRPATHLPGRLSDTSNVAREQQLQQASYGYQQTALRDLLAINEYNPALNNPGENLYLPVNFVSHLRGSRNEDEEICQTPTGSKLYLANNPRKLQPEKLTFGLFFGANARILARLIPNLSPELSQYLDYLRKIGDLLVNYTSASVFLLDHEHRFEVAELPTTNWNSIDATLSLNLLKKKDATQTVPTVSRIASA
jgi:hypothetical protein